MPRRHYVPIVLVVGLAFVCAGLHSSAQDAQEKVQPSPNHASAQARRDAAKKVYEASWEIYVQLPQNAHTDVDYYHDWSVRWMQAERDLGKTKAEQITALEGHLKRMQFWKDLQDGYRKKGQAGSDAPAAAEFFRLEAEDWLAAAKGAGK